MTRETKIGLLVGLGIILLVGIIVSDHLAIVHDQTAADLTHFASQSQRSIATGEDRTPRTTPATANRRTSVLAAPATATPTRQARPIKPLPAPTAVPVRPEPVRPKRFGTTTAGDRLAAASGKSVPTLSQTGAAKAKPLERNPERSGGGVVKPTTRRPVVHYVKSGESLWTIAQKYYGTGDNWQWIAQANPQAVGANGSVRVGVRLVVPASGDGLAAGRSTRRAGVSDSETTANKPQRVATRTPRPSRSAGRTYTVGANDSLYKIAERTLGDGRRWQAIYQANRDQLDDPDSLRVGQRLKVPAR